jgi:tetratricopeptide (TPR) repeat protein
MEAAFYRAQIYLQSDDTDRAMADLNAVLAAQPHFTPARLLRARVQLLRGNCSAALADLNAWLMDTRGLRLTDQNAAALEARGEIIRTVAGELPVQAMAGALELARQDLSAAANLGDHSPRLLFTQGAVLELFGDIQGALSAYTQALQANPGDNTCQLSRAWAYQKAGDNPHATEDFRAVIHRDPANAEAHVGLAFVLAGTSEFTQARNEAAQALLTGDSDYLILHNAACVFAQLSESEADHKDENQSIAISMLRKALELWKVSGKGPDEIKLIEEESSFSPSLRGRTDFQQLVHTS